MKVVTRMNTLKPGCIPRARSSYVTRNMFIAIPRETVQTESYWNSEMVIVSLIVCLTIVTLLSIAMHVLFQVGCLRTAALHQAMVSIDFTERNYK